MTISDFYQSSLEGKLAIIDVREAYEFDYGHVPGAVNLPLSDFEGYDKRLSKDTPY
ncbi:MAG: rhodanese-like domain-containing protein, partial [Lactococcus raffinolactis]